MLIAYRSAMALIAATLALMAAEAGRYTLLDHDRALQRVMPMVAERGLGIVVGGPYLSLIHI